MKVSIKKILAVMLSMVIVISVILIYRHANSPRINFSQPSTPSASTAGKTASAAPSPAATPNTSAVYAASIQADNETDFKSSWDLDAGNHQASLKSSYLSAEINVAAECEKYDIRFYHGSISFLNGSTYTVSFMAESDAERNITLTALDANTGNVIDSSDYTIDSTNKEYTLAVVPKTNYYNGSLSFYIGGKEGNVMISNIRVMNDDVGNTTRDIKVNQVGYASDDIKRCTFSYSSGDFFDLVNQDTGEIAYTGAVLNPVQDPATGESSVSFGDFSTVMTEGIYYIRSQTGITSYPFRISSAPYSELQKSLVHMLSLQRCGSDLDASWAGPFAHGFCHSQWPFIYGTTQSKQAGGGWHDAADYGRYVTTGAKAVSDLLISYLMNPDAFTDDTNGPDSGNWQPDSLDEAVYELSWFATMFNSNGGVYARILSPAVSGAADPSTDDQALYLIDPDTESTGDVAAVMEIASVVWKEANPDFAKNCSILGEAALKYLETHSYAGTSKNPSDINGGQYNDDYDMDERFYAYAAAYYATGNTDYLSKAKTEYEANTDKIHGASFTDTGAFGKYLILKSNAVNDDTDFYNTIHDSLIQEADTILKQVQASNYGVSLNQYIWGSNGFAIDNGEVLMMAYDIEKDQKYRQAAVQQVNYVLGQNSLNICFVTTYGSVSPHHVHQYASNTYGIVYPGALVGGPNSDREDQITQGFSSDTAPAKMYSDNFVSFSTNEVSVYWNSALIALTGMLS